MAEPLTIASTEQDRFDRSRRISWLDLDSISKSRIFIVGAGALGNEVAKDAVLSGFKDISIVDMDTVARSNLNRCLFFREEDVTAKRNKADAVARGLRDLYPDATVRPVVKRIEDVDDCDLRTARVALGCLDSIAARMHVNARTYSLGIPYIDGGMEGFSGKVALSLPPDRACLQCGMNRTHAQVANLRFSCTGSDVVFHEPRLAAEITTTSIVSAVMVREALKVVSGHPEMLLTNAFFYDGARNSCEELEIPLDPDCPVHRTPSSGYR
jgi:molybdopterin/thiamine biosynthesis adenylyltransferase